MPHFSMDFHYLDPFAAITASLQFFMSPLKKEEAAGEEEE